MPGLKLSGGNFTPCSQAAADAGCWLGPQLGCCWLSGAELCLPQIHILKPNYSTPVWDYIWRQVFLKRKLQ